jgi:MFS family permease
MGAAVLSSSAARRFFTAHAQSCLGSGLAVVALPLIAYERFGTAWAVTGVLMPDLLPAILLGPLLGALVDRIGWRACATIADITRCAAFALMLVLPSLPWMIAAATLAGLGSALFSPAALAGLPRLAPGDRRPAAMGLFGALDDFGLTVGPAVAGLLLAIAAPTALMAINAVSFAISAALIASLRRDVVRRRLSSRPGPSLLAEARAGIRLVMERPELRLLVQSSTAVVLCIGVNNVGEVVLARQALGVGGSGLAALMTAGGIGTVAGSLAARFSNPWQWRRAYVAGLACMGADLFACALIPHFWILLPVFVVGGFGNSFALVHDRLLLSDAAPEELHGRLFALQKTCTSFAFAVSFVGASALIVAGGIQLAFLCSGFALCVVLLLTASRLRAVWPAPSASGGTLALGATRAR